MATLLGLIGETIAFSIVIAILAIAYLDLLPQRDKTKGSENMGYVGTCPKCGHEGEHRLKKTWTITGRKPNHGKAPIIRISVFQCPQCRKPFRKGWKEGVKA